MYSASEPSGTGTDPARVFVSKSKGVTIEWRDGHRSQYSLQYLRDHCPCATCTGAHQAARPASPFPIFKPAARLETVDPAGNYALRFIWSDGHNTGIYTWEHLRGICNCPECASLRA